MKAKNILLLAALAVAVILTGCKSQDPFDTQSKDDAPRILVPYETETGQLSYTLANPDTPLYDSVVVTPSAYTTVNWYMDNVLVFTGTKINMCFPAGVYDLRIEAVTTADKRTSRTGSVTVRPYDTDPYFAAPAGGNHWVPGIATVVNGQNMDQVAHIILANDYKAEDVVTICEPTAQDAGSLTFTLPATADGRYYLRFSDSEDKNYGSGFVEVHNGSVVLAGFEEFVPGDTWVLTGVSLDNVASVKVADQVITELTATATSVTLVAPNLPEGDYLLSMKNKDGSDVLFVTATGTLIEVTTSVSTETTLWTGPEYLQWNENRVRIEATDMAAVPAGSTIIIYYEKLPAGHEGYYEGEEYKEYQKMKVMTAWWNDLFPEFDVTDETPNPYTFVYTEEYKTLVEGQNALSIAGWGLMINKITYK
jgi:hypothetical protein